MLKKGLTEPTLLEMSGKHHANQALTTQEVWAPGKFYKRRSQKKPISIGWKSEATELTTSQTCCSLMYLRIPKNSGLCRNQMTPRS
jgi:hypothetical protein